MDKVPSLLSSYWLKNGFKIVYPSREQGGKYEEGRGERQDGYDSDMLNIYHLASMPVFPIIYS
jgi:hypothetical protein